MAFLDSLFNPVLLPLMNKSPLLGILLVSLVLSFIVVLVYKYFTNQVEMKRLKEQQKEYQQKFKELKDKPDEVMKLQKEAMGKNFEYMKHSLKATLITMLPIILVFGWMNAHLAYEPIYPGEIYSLTAQFKEGVAGDAELLIDEGSELVSPAAVQPVNSAVTWKLKSAEGERTLTVKAGNAEKSKEVLISREREYAEPLTRFTHADVTAITIDYNKLIIFPIGFRDWLGCLGMYLKFTLIFSSFLREGKKGY